MGREKSYIFIVNPKARSGLGQVIWNTLEPELLKRRVRHEVYRTEYRRHAEKIAAEISRDGKEHTVVVLGGDGTVNEVVNGIGSFRGITLGYIPIGSSNDFARGLGIPRKPEDALDIVLSGRRVEEIDVGVLRRGRKERRFAVSAGIGFDAAVCHQVCVSRWKAILNKLGLGKLSYAAVALGQLIKSRPQRAVLTLEDGRKRVLKKLYFAAFMNLPFEGGGFRFCPDASAKDGMLDVAALSGISGVRLLAMFWASYRGKHTKLRGVTMLKCRKARVETEFPLPLHTDGEPSFLRKEIEVEVMGERLRVITG